MNVNKVITKDYENKPRLRATAKQTQSNPIKANFRGKIMLLRMTITGRRNARQKEGVRDDGMLWQVDPASGKRQVQ